MKLTVNRHVLDLDVDAEMPLLWALRDVAGIKGPKYGCGIAACGACTVIIDGVATRSCSIAVGDVDGTVRTIDGLAEDGVLHPVQRAWIDEQVPQCGYCQAGQIMNAVALLEANPAPTDSQIDEAMRGNLCRCGTYSRIRAAIRRASDAMAPGVQIET